MCLALPNSTISCCTAATTIELAWRTCGHVAGLGLARREGGSNAMNRRHAEPTSEESAAAVRDATPIQATDSACVLILETNPRADTSRLFS